VLTKRGYLVVAFVGGSVFAFKKWKKTPRGREQWDRFKLRFPFKIGDIVQKVCLARFSRTYSALIAAGVPMLQAIEITGKTAGNKVVEKAMNAVRESVKSGGTIAAPMRDEPSAFPLMVTQMIAVGEETGALESMLSKVADFYEDEVNASLKALTSILEPLMIMVVGAMVGFIVVSMYLPMFKVYDQIR
jgi:type IV pilus assembly protein PilC